MKLGFSYSEALTLRRDAVSAIFEAATAQQSYKSAHSTNHDDEMDTVTYVYSGNND